MMEVSQQRTKTMLAIHGWSGILLGALLYLVIVTGVVAVFAEEINDWASPLQHSAPHEWPVGVDAKLRELAATVKPEYQEELTMFARAGGRLRAFFHHHVPVEGQAFPQEYGTKFDLHPETLEVLDRKEGWGDDIDEADAPNALADFLVHLHINLHLPDPYGFFLTGILGLAMLVAAVTGFVIHRHLLRELFTLRKYRKGLLMRRDTHVIAASWNLPFAFILAFTGSYFSFTSSVGFPALAMVAFGGDQVAMSETLNGSVTAENTAPAMPADFDRVLADATQRAGAPTFIIVDHYGRADARITLFTAAQEGALYGRSLVYDGSSGALLLEKPFLGTQPSLGSKISSLMAPLHFGNFAGIASKGVWFALGFASAYVTFSGMLLWTTRRAAIPAWHRMTRAITCLGFGLLLALALTAWGYFIGRAIGLAALEPPMVIAFSAATFAAVIATARLHDAAELRQWLLATLGFALLLTPALRLLAGGPGWTAAISADLHAVLSMDLAFAIGGAFCLRTALHSRDMATRATVSERLAKLSIAASRAFVWNRR